MSKLAAGEKLDTATDDREGATIIAVVPTVDGNFKYFVDTDGYGALQSFAEENLVAYRANLM
jgi:hypothetical protein